MVFVEQPLAVPRSAKQHITQISVVIFFDFKKNWIQRNYQINYRYKDRLRGLIPVQTASNGVHGACS